MKKPFVSIIIPTLNEEKYIEPTLKSIKNQDYRGKYEIIIADSKSKDKTVKIAKKYADKIIITKRRGVSVGRNLGAKHAKGEILLFVDADTILLPNVVSKVVKQFRRKKVVGVTVPMIGDDPGKNVYYLISDSFYRLLTKINLQPVYAVCFACRKKAFFEAGGFDEKLKVAEDIELGGRLKKIGKIVHLKDTFAITSARRIKKWSIIKQTMAWPLGYISIKLLKKQPAYPPIR